MSSDEQLILDELNKLRAEIEENWHMMEYDYEKMVQQQQQQQQQQQLQQQNSSSSIPTVTKKAKPSQQFSNRLLKRSLRPSGSIPTNSNSSTTTSATSVSAKQAANIIWAPSNSINTNKSNSLTSTSSNENNQFAGFDSHEDLALKPKVSSHSPNSPYDSQDDDEIVDNMIQLKLKHQNQQRLKPKDRSKMALKASSQVRLPHRPETKTQVPKLHHRQHSSNSPQRMQKHSSPVRVPVLASEELEDLAFDDEDEALFKQLKIDPIIGKQILNDMNSNDDEVHWSDIAGLESAKQALMETVVWPLLRPDLFTGLRQPPNGMLLFGPPGTGKTMLARAAATESGSNFFSIQASSITSKFLGESEKLVKSLFLLAKAKAPSIIFVDEIDSIMGQRSESGENDSMRRVKNEFLVQWSGLTKSAGRGESSRVLVLAATNLPWQIDDAARRRFVKRQYIPLPEYETRMAQFTRLLSNAENDLSKEDLETLVEITEGYSGSDIDSLTKDAAMSTTRGLTWEQMMDKDLKVRPIGLEDFKVSMQLIRPSVGKAGLEKFEKWVKEFGSSGA